MTDVQTILDKIEEFAPLELKYDGDPTGFQIGDKTKSVKKVMTTLDIRPNVVKEAIENNIDLIVAHHPIMFRPAKNLDISNPQNKMYSDLLSNNIAVHSAHTNVDATINGMNYWLAEALSLKKITSINELNGLGITGYISHPEKLENFSEKLKKIFNLPEMRIVKPYNDTKVNKVGIIGGDGGKFYPTMIEKGVDTFITGDVYYHTAHDMQSAGLNVIDPGHHVEAIFIKKMAELLNLWNQQNNWDIVVIESKANTEPFTFI